MLRLKRGRAPECKDVAQNFAVDLSIRPANPCEDGQGLAWMEKGCGPEWA